MQEVFTMGHWQGVRLPLIRRLAAIDLYLLPGCLLFTYTHVRRSKRRYQAVKPTLPKEKLDQHAL